MWVCFVRPHREHNIFIEYWKGTFWELLTCKRLYIWVNDDINPNTITKKILWGKSLQKSSSHSYILYKILGSLTQFQSPLSLLKRETRVTRNSRKEPGLEFSLQNQHILQRDIELLTSFMLPSINSLIYDVFCCPLW